MDNDLTGPVVTNIIRYEKQKVGRNIGKGNENVGKGNPDIDINVNLLAYG